jgi:hypothetical protein
MRRKQPKERKGGDVREKEWKNLRFSLSYRENPQFLPLIVEPLP